MSVQRTTPVIPTLRRCGQYTPGHDVHYIQARLSSEHAPRREAVIEDIADDGTITFADGSTFWNHDPVRLRAIVQADGARVDVRSYGVLKVPHATGGGGFLVCVAEAATPCADEPAGPRPGESVVDELIRRGGVLRPGRQVLAELGLLEPDDE